MKNYIILVILACTSLALQAQTSTGKHHIKYLDINTGNSDYGVDFIDNKVVFTAATSERVSNNSKYQAHLDLFEGEVGEEGEIINKSRNKGIISKRITKTGATFTSDKKTVYFTAKKYVKRKSKRPARSEMFKADIDEYGIWQNIQKLSINKKSYSIEAPTINKEENKIYFSADLPTTLGGKDIFVADIKEDGTLSEPRNLGDKINTPKDEITPFIADNNFLYYSSNGREDSIGNFDIYTSEAFENIVSEPLHLDSPINSINDDFAYIVNSDKGYFSSNRLQGQKNNDIYSFYIEPDKPIKCLQEIVGTVRDKETEILLAEALISVIDDEGQEIKSLTTDENGNYRFSLDCRSTFTIRATKTQYTEEEHIVNTANYLTAPPLEVNQGLSKDLISTENEIASIKVNPIYFGFDKSNLNSNAKIELDKIVKVMKENNSLIVEAASHTDSRGSSAYNQKLSERRSQASVDYIISKGIDESRIKSKGYGESQLLNNCKNGVRCTNDQHHFNRRTEFIIMNKQVLNKPKGSITTNKVIAISEVEPVESKLISDDIVDETELLEAPSTSNTEKKKETEQPNDVIENNNQEDNSNDSNIEKKEGEINLIFQETFSKSLPEINQDIKTELTNDSIVEKNDSDQTEAIQVYKVNERKSKFSEKNITSEIDFSQPDIQEEVIEKVVTNTNISIVDNHEIVSRKGVLPKDDDVGKLMIDDFKSISTKKENDFNKEEVTVSTDTSSLSVNKVKDNKEIISNFATDKTVDNPETEIIKPSDYNTSSKSNEDKDSANKSDEQSNNLSEAANKLFDEEVEDIEANANNFSRDFTNDIVITDYKKSTKPVEKEAEVIIAEQKDKFKKDYITSTESLKKEEVLMINSIDVSPISIKNNGKYVETSNSNKVDVMRINFQIDNNKYINSGYKEVFILIQNPAGTILNRKGTFEMKNGKELTYTEKTNAYYNNNHLNISMVTDRFIQRIIKGVYTITIYIEGYPVGLEMVELS